MKSSWLSSSSFPKQIQTAYLGLHEKLRPLNDSKFFAGLIVVLLNLGSKLVDVRLSKPMQSYFRNSFSRQALLFAMIWMPTRDVLAALIVSTLIIFSIDCLMNDESKLCVLPTSFTQHHHKLLAIEAMTSSGGGGGGGASGAGASSSSPPSPPDGGGTPGELSEFPGAAKLQRDIDNAIRALENARTMLQRQSASSSGTPEQKEAAATATATTAAEKTPPAPAAGTGTKWFTPIPAGSF